KRSARGGTRDTDVAVAEGRRKILGGLHVHGMLGRGSCRQILCACVIDIDEHDPSQGKHGGIAASCSSPCTPQPTMVALRESARAKNFAATAVAAPVRRAVTLPESMMASGVPLAASARTIVPWIVGSPHRRGLSEKLPLVFAAK